MPTLKEMRKLLSSPEFCKPLKREEFKVKLPDIELISYKVDGGTCITPCKYFMERGEEIRLGTIMCSDCVHFENVDYEKRIVKCSYLRDKALKIKE
jgi:hypothetical protein